MSLKISTDPAPLSTDEDGVVRVGGTGVRLDTVRPGPLSSTPTSKELIIAQTDFAPFWDTKSRDPEVPLTDAFEGVTFQGLLS